MPVLSESPVRRLYDGAGRCHTDKCCPVVDELPGGRVVIHDPAKPESGSFTMTRAEYDALLASAQPAA